MAFQATAEANNLSAVAGAKEVYASEMEFICGGDKPFLSTSLLEGEHNRVKDKALEYFQGRRKMGGAEFSERYRDKLEHVRQFSYKTVPEN